VTLPDSGSADHPRGQVLLLLLLTCLTLCWDAGLVQAKDLYSTIRQEQASGLMGPTEARMQRFYALFRPELLDERYATLPRKDTPCATSLLAELRAHRSEHSEEDLELIRQVTDPWHGLNSSAAGAAARDTCVPPEVAQDGLGPYPALRSSEHFAVHYTPSLAITESRVAMLLDYFEESLEVLHDEMGFYPPARIDTYQLLVAVEFIPSSGTGGYTQLHACGMGEPMAFIVVNSQWFQEPSLLQSLAPHELFHAIQVRYGFDEFWASGNSDNLWFIEASAVYQESVVYPDLTESLIGQADRWAREPWRSLETNDSSGFQYGSFLTLASIGESLGGSDWHHDLWDQVLGRSGYWLIGELDEVLIEQGGSFADEYGLYVERAATMDFQFSDELNTPADMAAVGQGGLVEKHTFDELPLDIEVEELTGAQLPEFLGTDYVLIEGPESSSDESGLVLRVVGSTGDDGGERGWEVRVIATQNGEARARHDLALSASEDPDDADGTVSGTVYLAGLGDAYDGVLLGASPTYRGATDGQAPWSYQAWSASALGEPGFGPVPDEVADELRGCAGCRLVGLDAHGMVQTNTIGGAVWLLLTLAYRRSRRAGLVAGYDTQASLAMIPGTCSALREAPGRQIPPHLPRIR